MSRHPSDTRGRQHRHLVLVDCEGHLTPRDLLRGVAARSVVGVRPVPTQPTALEQSA